MSKKAITLKATNIKWDIDIEDGYGKLDEMSVDEASEKLGIPAKTYANMTTSERHDYAFECWHRSEAALAEFMDIDDEMDIPDPTNPDWDEDTISDYISDESGWCHGGFTLECNLTKDELIEEGLDQLAEIID